MDSAKDGKSLGHYQRLNCFQGSWILKCGDTSIQVSIPPWARQEEWLPAVVQNLSTENRVKTPQALTCVQFITEIAAILDTLKDS